MNKRFNKKLKIFVNTPIYRSWANMKKRCLNRNSPDFKNYGGRGITVCDRWQDFSLFYEDMGHSYKDGLTIERISNGGNYCKENCKWATRKEQNNNTRATEKAKRFIYQGKKFRISELADLVGLKRTTLAMRFRYGWSLNEALLTKTN